MKQPKIDLEGSKKAQKAALVQKNKRRTQALHKKKGSKMDERVGELIESGIPVYVKGKRVN